MNETEVICRFCLKTIEKPIPIDEMVKEIIEILMLKLDLRMTPEPFMCYGCAETLKTAFDFKSACIYTEDCLYPFIEGKNETKLDLREVYLKVNDSEDIEGVEGREVCRFCMKPSDSGFCTPLEVIDENVEIKKLLENYLPELVMGAIEKPVACENCLSFLRQYSLFVTRFSNIEQQIQSYAKTLGRDCVGELDLRQMRDFSLSNVTKREVKTIGNNKVTKQGVMVFNEIESEEKIIPAEKIECEQIENGESKIIMAASEILKRAQEEFDGFAGNDELFTSNEILVIEEAQGDVETKCPFLEHLETEIKGKYIEENAVHVEETKGEIQKSQRMPSPHKIDECQELEARLGVKLEEFEIKKEDDECDGNENYILSLNEPSMIFSGDDEVKPTLVDILCNPEEHHTAQKSDPDESASESEPNLQAKGEVEEVEEKKNKEKATIYRCKLCPFKTKLKYCLTRHMLVHKDISEAKVYRCKLCPYKTKWKENLPKHMLVHKDISEITAHRCKLCPYKTKRKDNLLKHMLVHKDVSEITIHRCKSCPYKSKWKSALTKHILVHKDISEVTAHRCKLCPYETKRRTDLVKHMLVHKDHSEVTTYDSIFCSYIAKRKGDLNRHMLTHKDNHTNASEIETSLPVKLVEAAEKTIYNCKRCPYKAKFKCKLIRHMLVHKDISEVTTYDCSFCSYKTKRKTDLPKHMLIHKDFSEVTTYDCNVCSQTTKHKNFMRKHMLTHQDKPKVKLVKDVEETIHHCKHCPYKNKFKYNLTRHMLVHKDISEVQVHRCKLCPYKTKRSNDLTKHILIHTDPSERPTYDCDICSYKAKTKRPLIKHMVTHKDNSKDAKSAQTQEESMSEHQEFEGCSTIKSEEVDIKDEEDECDDESNKL